MARSAEQVWFGDAFEHGDISADIDLEYGWAAVRVCTPTTSGLAFNLPDARLLKKGGPYWWLISEETGGGDDVLVKDAGGNTLATITPTSLAEVSLVDNSTANGEWHVEVASYGAIPAPPDPNRAYFINAFASNPPVQEFDPDASVWTQKTAGPVVFGRGVVGFDLQDRGYETRSNISFKDFYEYDPDVWTDKTDSDDRHGTSTGPANGISGTDDGDPQDGYIFGSTDGLQLAESYDRVGNAWTSRADQSSTHQAGLRGAGRSGTIYLFGGSGAVADDDGDEYDIVGDSYTTGTSLPTGKAGQGTVVIGDDLYIPGGLVTTSTRTDEHNIFDMAAETFSLGTDAPDDINEAGLVNTGLSFIMGGGRTTTNPGGSLKCWIFDRVSFIAQPDMSGPTASQNREFSQSCVRMPA